MYVHVRTDHRGYTLVEALIVIAIATMVFGAVFLTFQSMFTLLGSSKAKAGALALAIERMEYVRSLSYNDVGTVSGVPSGSIPQNSTTTLNGIEYAERVLIQYVDDDADGTGGSDSNGILADYKQIKLEYSWDDKDTVDTLSMISNIVPVGIESTAGGGTIRVNVFDAAAAPVQNATVDFFNDSIATTVDTTRFTNNAGVTHLSGAPAGSGYEIIVSSPGYSIDRTYEATSTNPAPDTPPVTVSEGLISTMNFQIDHLSDLLVRTVEPSVTDTFSDTFASDALLESMSSTTVSGGSLMLSGGGPYAPGGSAQSTSTEPSTMTSWHRADFIATGTASTSVFVQVLYDNGGSFELIPESDLPGNSAGFTESPIDLRDLDPSTYAELALYGSLGTTDSSETPEIEEWSVTYIEDEPPIANITFDITGDKTIGTDGSGQPVYKYDSQFTTDGSGEAELTDIEWDIYSFELATPGYTVVEACPAVPYSLDPDVSETLTFTLENNSATALLVHVTEADGTPIPDALVELSNTGISDAGTTSLCGQVFFNSGLYDDTNYVVTADASGYASTTITGVEVSGATSTLEVVLN